MGLKGYLRISGGRKLLSPVGVGTRPTTGRVREAVMNLIAGRLRGAIWLDLCSGSGAVSCEAMQRGAKYVVAVEKNVKVAKICKSNLLATQSGLNPRPEVECICGEVLKWLSRNPQQNLAVETKQKFFFDFVYIDPPYGSDLYFPVLRSLLKGYWINRDSVVLCEYSSDLDMEIPSPWVLVDRRQYGDSSLLLVSPPENYLDDTDSRPLRTDLEE